MHTRTNITRQDAGQESASTFTSYKLDILNAINADPRLRLKPNAFKVAAAIMMFVNQNTREAWAAIETICDRTSLNDKTVDRALNDLRDAGWLRSWTKYDRKQKRLHSRYRFLTARLGEIDELIAKRKNSKGSNQTLYSGTKGSDQTFWSGDQRVRSDPVTPSQAGFPSQGNHLHVARARDLDWFDDPIGSVITGNIVITPPAGHLTIGRNPTKTPSSPSAPKRRRAPISTSRPMPDDFRLDEAMIAYAAQRQFTSAQIGWMFEKFANHHQAKGSMFADWRAAWRTWVCNQTKYDERRDRKANATTTQIM
jgi:helix-turn-helix protein